MKKNKKINRPNIVLTAVIGSTLGAAAALAPLLNREYKMETVSVVDFNVTNTSYNSSTFTFKLNLDDPKLSESIVEYFEAKKDIIDQKLNVNILDNSTKKIITTQEADYNPVTEEYSLDVTNLESGKIYTVQVVDTFNERIKFSFGLNTPVIITKSEISKITYELDKRDANIKIFFNDEQKQYLDKDVKVTYHAEGSDEIKTFTAKVVEKIVDENAKTVSIELEHAIKGELERNTKYIISDVRVIGDGLMDEPIHFASNVINNFKTSIPYTQVEQLNSREQETTESSVQFDLVFNNKDKDIKNKVVNIEYYKYNEAAKDSKTNEPVYGPIQLSKKHTIVKETVNGEDIFTIKNINLPDLEEGSTYRIARIYPEDLNNPQQQVVVEATNLNLFEVTTLAVIAKIEHYTKVEQANFMQVVFKDDSFTLNNKKVRLTYFEEANKNDKKTEITTVTGNVARLNLLNLKKLTKYKVERIELLAEDGNTIQREIEFTKELDEDNKEKERQKKFITIASKAQIDDVTVSEIKETSAKIRIDFEKNEDFIVGKKAKLKLIFLGSNDEIYFPEDIKDAAAGTTIEEKSVEIQKVDDKIFVEFDATGLEGGRNFYIDEVQILKDKILKDNILQDVDPDMPILETFYNLNVDGSKKKFITKAIVYKISHSSQNKDVILNIEFNNSYLDENTFNNKEVTIKYQLADGSGSEKTINETIKNNFVSVTVNDIELDKDYKIISIQVPNYQTSIPSDNILDVSTNIKEEDKIFSAFATYVTVDNIKNTNIQEKESTISFTFDDESTFLVGKTIVMEYKRLGKNDVLGTMEAVVDANRTVTFNVTDGLEIGRRYLVSSLKLKKEPTKPKQPTILYNIDLTENDKIFRTSNGVGHIETDTSVERKARVIVKLNDATGEYAGRDVVLTYKSLDKTNAPEEKIGSDAAVVNGKAFFSLSDLGKTENYEILKVELKNANGELENIPFSSDLTEANKKFKTAALTAKVTSIEAIEDARTTTGAKVKITFDEIDKFMWAESRNIVLTYRSRGSNTDSVKTIKANTYDEATKSLTFDLTGKNLESGSVFNIISFTSNTNGNEVDVLFDHLPEKSKIFTTKPTVKSVVLDNKEEENLKVYLRFNDAPHDVNSELEIIIKETDTTKTKEYKATSTSKSGLYIFTLDGLPKTKEVKLEKVSFTNKWNNEEIPFSAAVSEESRKTIISASSVTAKKVETSAITKDSATVKLTIIEKDEFVVGEVVQLIYRGQTSSEPITTELDNNIVVKADRTVQFNLTNLEHGSAYEVVGFKIKNLKFKFDTSEAKLENRRFTTTSTVKQYEYVQTSETSMKVVATINDNARKHNKTKAKIKYVSKVVGSQPITVDQPVDINSGKAVFNLTGLTKGGTYEIQEFCLETDATTSTYTILDPVAETVDKTKEFPLIPATAQITKVESTSTVNSGTMTLRLGTADAFAVNKAITVKIRKQGSATDLEPALTGTLAQDNDATNQGGLKVEFNDIQNLEAGTIYVISSVEIDTVKKVQFASTVSDGDRQLITKPNIARLSFSPKTETVYTASILLRDPIAGSGDPRDFNGKKVRFTYIKLGDLNGQFNDNTEIVSEPVTIQDSIATFELNGPVSTQNQDRIGLSKDRRYKVTRVEFEIPGENGVVSTWEELTFNPSIEETKKEFRTIPKTATITEIVPVVAQDSAVVKFKLDKPIDEYMFSDLNGNKKPLTLTYRSSNDKINKTITIDANSQDTSVTPAVTAISEEADKVVYTFNLTDLGRGSNVRFIKMETTATDKISILWDSKFTEEDKQINTIGSVQRIVDSPNPDNETSWDIKISLKDLKETLKGKKLELKYVKVDPNDDATEHISPVSTEIDENNAVITIPDLEKFAQYKITSICVLQGDGDDTSKVRVPLEIETRVTDADKLFKQIPRTATIVSIIDKQQTENSASFKLKFSELDKNYLKQYPKITLNYKLRGNDNLEPAVNQTIDPNDLTASFSFNNLAEGQYEIISVVFEGDVLGTTNSINNPNGLRIVFDSSVTLPDKTFQTSTRVMAVISKNPADRKATILVRVKDASSRFVGQKMKLKYRDATLQDQYETLEFDMSPSLKAGQSEAEISIVNSDVTPLDKKTTYIVEEILIGGVQVAWNDVADNANENFDLTSEENRKFVTTGKFATVKDILGTDTIFEFTGGNSITLVFNEEDKYLSGSTKVEPNYEAPTLYLNLTSKSTGITKQLSAKSTFVNGETKVVFNTDASTDLIGGDEYEIVSISSSAVASADALIISFDDALDETKKTFKVKPSIGLIRKDVSVETKTTLDISVNNTWDNYSNKTLKVILIDRDDNDNDNELAPQSYTIPANFNSEIIKMELTNLQKDRNYGIKSILIDDVVIDFATSTNNDANKNFKTILRTADVVVTSNSDYQTKTGKFTLQFGDLDDYLFNDGWKANISYQVVNKKESQITNNTPILVPATKTIEFQLDNLTSGQEYEITNISFTNDRKQDIINANIKPNPGKIKTKSQIKDIYSKSTTEKEATIIMELDNVNKYIPHQTNLTINYELVNAFDGNTFAGNASSQLVYVEGDQTSTVQFNLTGLKKGQQYKIVSVQNGTEDILFNDGMTQDTDSKRLFNVIATSTEIQAINPTQLETTSATLEFTLDSEDIFLFDGNQKASISYERIIPTNGTLQNTSLINVDTTTKKITISLSGLEAGSEYEIKSISLIPNSVNVTFKQGISKTFVTKPEINSISNIALTETTHQLDITFSDFKDTLINKNVSIKVAKLDNPTQEITTITLENNAVQLNNHKATLKLQNLEKNTNYTIMEILVDGVAIPFSQELQGNSVALKNFKTKAETATISQIKPSGKDTQDWIVDSTTETSNLKLKFENALDQTFMPGRNLELRYIKLDDSNQETGDEKTSPVNAQVKNDGTVTFELSKLSDDLESGTKYKVKSITDLSSASQRITINIPATETIYFNTLVKQPTATEIKALKSEKNPANSGNYAYTTDFEITLNDPKNSLNWNKTNNQLDWSVSIVAKANNIKTSDTNIDSSKISISRKDPSTSVLKVTVTMDDIREFMGRELVFTISNINYNRILGRNDDDTRFEITHLESGALLQTSLLAKLFVESGLTTHAYTNTMLGLGFKIYDPTGIIRTNDKNVLQRGDKLFVTNMDITRTPISFELESTDAFGRSGQTSNSWENNGWNNSSNTLMKINESTYTYAGSGFDMKQLTARKSATWDAVTGITMHSTSAVAADAQGYAKLYAYFTGNLDDLHQKQLRVKTDSLSILQYVEFIDASGTKTTTTDIQKGITLVNYKSTDFKNIFYSFPQNQYNQAYNGTTNNNNWTLGNAFAYDWNIDPESILSIKRGEYVQGTKEFKVTVHKPTTTTANTGSDKKVYAVFEDKDGNIYLAGNDQGEPISLDTDGTNDELVFKLNGTGITRPAHLPTAGTKLNFIGVWVTNNTRISALTIQPGKVFDTLIQFTV